ncbi:MAG TPA: peroxidase family protein [Candidatus Limnocylindrales bacterium]|nr:peroxidase family protein [Candidatus Limnocylindrales bacterium]
MASIHRRPDQARPARDHCLAPSRSVDPLAGSHRYIRMFPVLPHLKIDPALLHAIGRAGGACDTANASRQEASGVAAGVPVLGQFIAHDITADRSPVSHHDDEAMLRNVRSARLNLECLYGEGPVGNPYLFSRKDPAKLLLGINDQGGADDLPRNQEGIALVGDPRQDVHLLVSQMQVAMIKAHNRLVDRLREDGVAEADLFTEARRALTWHYQWITLFDFLPQTIGEARFHRLLENGPHYFRPEGVVSIPFEFADAAYRFGHSQMRQTYRLQRGKDDFNLFPDLVGFRPVPAERVIDWTLFFDVGGALPAMRARPIDACLPEALLKLPAEITGELDDDEYESLAVRDLQRGVATGCRRARRSRRMWGRSPSTRMKSDSVSGDGRARLPSGITC